MLIQETAIDTIDLKDDTFRISDDGDCPALRASMKETGQLNPVILMERSEGPVIVCGFRRIRALRDLGKDRVLARILPQGSRDPISVFRMAILDNISHRQFGPLEKALILHKLLKIFGLEEDLIIREVLPLLELSPAASVLRSFLLLHQVHPSLRQCFIDGRLTLASMDVLACKPAEIQDEMAALMGKIRLSASLQKKLLALLEDLSGSPAADRPLGNPEVVSILEDPGLSPFQKGEKIHEYLHRLRNPRLSQAADLFLARKKKLQIPGSIRVSAHPFFEEPGLHVEFDARDPEQFRKLAAVLQKAAESPDLLKLFEI